ncbi:MAG TPA: hypothetical protein VMM12_14900 [Longimicrobiales bacterium]|nr:hypothetical protein [Longimicrobiales bacterium]
MSGDGEGRSRKLPPEGIRSTPGRTGQGPVPVRDLVKSLSPEPAAAGAEAAPQWGGVERFFRRDDGEWIARVAGAGAYGTGKAGTARLVALHFCREDDPETPVREALIAAGLVTQLSPAELCDLFDRATPIEIPR